MRTLITLCFVVSSLLYGEIVIPGHSAYTEPDHRGLQIRADNGVSGWKSANQKVLWFGELRRKGKLTASVRGKGHEGRLFRLEVGGVTKKAVFKEGVAHFGDYEIKELGYTRFELTADSDSDGEGVIEALVLDGEASQDAHFNVKERRNAASVHLAYPVGKDERVSAFYNEVTAVEDPVATFYMACGFSRGYFGMQVNSETERRIIFSVWDSGSGSDAKDRTTVAKEDMTQLLAKGDGVEASVFGNEGTGGHSHLVYPWKTGEAQKFVVTVKPDGAHAIFSGYWFHPEKKNWMLIASFRAPKAEGYLRGLHSFSENFGGQNGHLRRKALYGPQWIASADGQWRELTRATFSHDPTGKEDRLDRFMGVENGHHFLSHGGFVEGFTKYGTPFDRGVGGHAPDLVVP